MGTDDRLPEEARLKQTLERLIPASRQELERAALEPIETAFADPVGAVLAEDGIEWTSVPDLIDGVRRTARFSDETGGTLVVLSAEFAVHTPYFSWLLRPAVRSAVKKSLVHMGDVLAARAEGAQPPKPRRPVWAPPTRMNSKQTAAIAAICTVLAITTYGGSLFAQAIDYVGRSFEASDASLGVVSALTRIGTLAAIIGSVAADRRGRRRILLFSTAGLSIASVLSGLAPNLLSFAILQTISRGFVNLAAVVALIALVEEAPEEARAYTLAVSSVLGATGYALGVVLLPLADIAAESWRALFLLSAVGLFLLPGLGKAVRESPRYLDLGERVLKSKVTEVVDKFYGGRFYVVALTGFLMNFFAAPFSQFLNRFLQEERDYSGLDVLLLRAVTQGIPAVISVWLGGKMAESQGRKPVAIWSTIATSLFTALFFLTSGPFLWLGLLFATFAGGLAGPSFATFNTELFPTERRGTAGAGLLAVAVSGSASGLLVAGYLSEPLNSIGLSVAVTGVAPLIVALFLIRLLPEARGVELDRISPPEV